ncbi:MAG: nuclear transport factor 2 family protein [Bdellovibrionia bacterium]
MSNKAKARAYFTAVNNYDESTIEQMVDENYIQHNPFVPTGRAAFVSLLPKLKAHGSKIENKRMLQDGPYIAMHHVWKNAAPFGKNEMAAFHIIRFDKAGLIAEHWNVMTELVSQASVDGETEINDVERTEKNKSIVSEFFGLWTDGTTKAQYDALSRFFHPGCREHGSRATVDYKRQHKLIGEGNFVLAIGEGILGEKPTACYDLFRLENGKIADHWNIYQEIPGTGLANDNTMFGFLL